MEHKTNETISNARGECRHEDHNYQNSMVGGYYSCNTCERTHDTNDYGDFFGEVIDYTTDDGAWDDDMWKWIEGRDLANFMVSALDELLEDSPGVHETKYTKRLAWVFLRATPLQKATALARAIDNNE